MVAAEVRSEQKPVILVADDDEMQRFLMRETLEAEGFEVELVADGEAALQRSETLRPDVVLLDVVMPGMDGYAVCAALRDRPFGAQMPIVMVTGQDDLDSVARAYDAGATDFIAKPLNWTLLRHRIRYVYRAGRTLKQLQASEARLAEAQRIAQLGSWEWKAGSDQIICSPEVFRIFRLSAGLDTMSLERLLERLYDDDAKEFRRNLETLIPAKPMLAAEYRLKLPDESDCVIAIHARLECEASDGQHAVKGTFQDVTERRLAEARLYHLANHDALTGLPNRSLFKDRLGQALSRAKREGIDAAAFCIDINRFKDINDTFGHAIGDNLLQQIGARLQNEVRGTDTVARLAGDEFAIAQIGLMQPAGSERLSKRILSTLSEPFEINGQELFVAGSIGVAVGPYDASHPDDLLAKADIALHRAKADGPGTCRFFEGGMDVAIRSRKAVELDLRQALADDWFELHYQPQVAVDSCKMIGVEALLRLRHPEKGLMMPDKFIGIAEETGLIVPIGTWVLRTACQQAMNWRHQGLPALRVAVNLSPLQFREFNLTETVMNALADSGLEASSLEVEITENILIRDTATVTDVLHKFKAHGIKIAMDDFGTGYSSLRYLQRFPFDRIKIDRSFISDVGHDSDSAAIVGAVIALSKRMNMATTAEGVESRDQLNYLRNEGCDEAQGFYFGRPMPAADFARMLGNVSDPEIALEATSPRAGVAG